MWTHFWDMHSGGDSKEPWEHIFIEAPETKAVNIFYRTFGHSPEDVACPCCGANYAVAEHDTLEEATEYHREYFEEGTERQSLEDFLERSDVRVIYAMETED